MSLSVSSRLAGVKASPTSAVVALVATLRAQGRDIISLGAGEPDFDTPQFVKDAAIDAINVGETKYTPIGGTVALKTAIQRKFNRDNNLSFEPEQILVSCGAKQSLFNLCLALLGPGDEAIIPAPYWVSYPDMVRLADAKPVVIDTGIENDFKIAPEQLEAAISDDTRLLFLNSPSNPTGASYTRAELVGLGDVLAAHPRIVVVADEIYEHIYWGDERLQSFASACPAIAGRTVTVNGVSKAYAMTGWRIGYAGGPESLIRGMTTIQSQSTSNPCSISQAAAIAALDGDQAPVRAMCEAYKARHDLSIAALNDMPGLECRAGEGSFYAFPRVAEAVSALGLANDEELVDRFVKNAGVACVPGTAFGAPGYLRISFACSQELLDEAFLRMNRVLSA